MLEGLVTLVYSTIFDVFCTLVMMKNASRLMLSSCCSSSKHPTLVKHSFARIHHSYGVNPFQDKRLHFLLSLIVFSSINEKKNDIFFENSIKQQRPENRCFIIGPSVDDDRAHKDARRIKQSSDIHTTRSWNDRLGDLNNSC